MKKSQKDNLILKYVLPLGLSCAAYLLYENNTPKVEKYSILSSKITKEVNIVALSDLHSKSFGKDNEKILKEIVKIQPDIILMPGDSVSSKDRNICVTRNLICVLSQICPVVMVLGNHEERRVDREELVFEYQSAGATVLRNQDIQIGEIRILGMNEKLAASRIDYFKKAVGTLKYENHDDLLKEFSQKDGFLIVLSHFPELFSQSGKTCYSKFNFDLMVSGHAHGGHVVLPFIGPVYSPGQGMFPKYAGGKYDISPSLIVSRGLGNDGPVPRVNNRPEITHINIKPC